MKPRPTGMLLGTSEANWGRSGVAATGLSQASATPMFDVELGQIFLRMRNLLGVSLWDMARRVGAEPTVIADLEAGALNALPPWPELTRLVDAYAAATGVDHQPILVRLLRTQISVGTHAAPHAAAYPVTITVSHPQTPARTMPPNAGFAAQAPIPETAFVPRTEGHRTSVSAVPTGVRRQMPVSRSRTQPALQVAHVGGVSLARSALNQVTRALVSTWLGLQRFLLQRVTAMAGLLFFVPVVLLMLAWLFPALLYAAVNPLPSLVAAPLKLGTDFLVSTLAPSREGLIWIDVGDPRLRKSDRLPERVR